MRNSDNQVLFSLAAARDTEAHGSQPLRAWLARQLREDLADPVQVRRLPDLTQVTAMRGIEIEVDRRRCRIDVRGRCDMGEKDWIEGRLDLHRPLTGRAWEKAWWFAIQRHIPEPLQLAAGELPTEQASDMILEQAQRSGLLPEARRRILRSLQLDPELLRLANMLRPGWPCTTLTYTCIWPLKYNHPQAWQNAGTSLWSLLGLGWNSHDLRPWTTAGELRQTLRKTGLSRNGWRLLCGLGTRLWLPMRHCHEFRRFTISIIVVWTNLVAASGRRAPPPQALTLAFGRMFSMNCVGTTAHPELARIVRLAWEEMDDLDPSARTAFARGPLEDVLRWWYAYGRTIRLPRKIGWNWLQRKAGNYRLTAISSDTPWLHFGRRRLVDGFRVEPLRSLLAVRRAGLELGNCMLHSEYSEAQKATEALFLIRNRERRAMAMFSAERAQSGMLELRSIRARYNQPASAALQQAASRYLRSINQTA